MMTNAEKQKKSDFFRKLALSNYAGLLLLIPLWHLVLSPDEAISPLFLIVLWWTPLFFPMRGLLKGNPYTYAWANFITMFYFMHSFTIMYAEPSERYLAVIEFILATGFFIGCCYYAKYQGQIQGLSIRLKKVKEEGKS